MLNTVALTVLKAVVASGNPYRGSNGGGRISCCSQSSLRTVHYELRLRVIGFRRKDFIGYKPLSYGEPLERTGSERIETTM